VADRMSAIAQLIVQAISEAPQGFAAQVNTFLGGLGPIGLQSVLVTRRGWHSPGPRLSATLLYTPGALTTTFAAVGFTGSTALGTAAAQATAFLAATPALRGHVLRDIGDQRRGRLDSDVLMLIYAPASLPNCGWDRSRMIIAQASAPIAPGAVGSAVHITGLGTAETITVTNRGTITWDAMAYGYVFPRQGTCTWDGVPTCCEP
jgi:hypothetical protein